MKSLFLLISIVTGVCLVFPSQARPTNHTSRQNSVLTNVKSYTGDLLASNNTDVRANNTRLGTALSRHYLFDAANNHNPGEESAKAENLQINAFTITTSASSAYCVTSLVGTTFSLPFTATNGSSPGSPFNPNNVFTAQLSDATGNFTSPTTIGTLTSTALSGTISATIPANTTAGTGYRIRVTASKPATTGSDNGSNIAIGLLTTSPYIPQAFSTAGTGSLLTAAGSSVTGYQWGYYRELGDAITNLVGKTSQTYTPKGSDLPGAGTYYLVCRMTTSNGCGTVTSNEVIIYVNCPVNTGANLITNGNFSSGNTSFTSDYNYSTNLIPEGNYVVGNNPRTYHYGFCDMTTEALRSPGGGNMLIANASNSGSQSVWKQTINVSANTDYVLSFYATNLSGDASSLLFGVYVDCFRTGLDVTLPYTVATCTWSKYTFQLRSGSSATTVNLAIRNISAAAFGNDIAIDDIQFYACQVAPTTQFTVANSFKWRGISSDWLNKDNWGTSCALPTCSDNVTIPLVGVGKVYPTISGNGAQAKSVTIDNGATLSIDAGYQLDICGDLINNGTLDSDPNAIISFSNNNALQLVSGNLTGTNKLGKVLINKTNSTDKVKLSNAMEIAGNLTLTKGNLDANGMQIKIGGDFANAGTFTPSSGTVEFNGTTNQNFTQTGTGQFYNLTINNGTATNTVTFNPAITTVTNQLTLTKGQAFTGTGSNEISVTNAATSALIGYSANSYVNGNIRRAVSGINFYDFPVGEANRYELISVNITSALTGTSNIMGVFNGSTPNGKVPGFKNGAHQYKRTCTAGYWTLTPNSQPSAGTFDLQINPVGIACDGVIQTLGKRPNSSGDWSLAGSTDVSTTRRNGYSSFSDVVQVSGDPVALPINLISFSGDYIHGNISLSWATASEQNNAFFQVKRSRDGLHFESIGRIDGNGTTSTSHNYRFIDNEPLPGINYYQLRQVDTDGMFEDSKVIGVHTPLKRQITWYPNSVILGQLVHFQISTKESVDYLVSVTDLMGRLMLQEKFIVEPGEHELSLPGSEKLTTGLYVINVYNLHAPLELYQGKLLVK